MYTLLLGSVSTIFASYNMTQGVTPMSHRIYDIHMLMFYVCVIAGIATFGVMFYALLKHRKSLGVTPAQSKGHLALEIIWTVVPLLILLGLSYPAGKILMDMDEAKEAEVNILVTGLQWKWKYEYLDHGFSFYSNLSTPMAQRNGLEPKGEHYLLEVDEPVVVPIHTHVRFLFTSRDVNHSWWVPDFAVKVDCIPGYINEGWVYVEKPGTYRGQCTELCGMLHGFMPIVVEAKTQEDYQKWLAKRMDIVIQKEADRVLTKDEAMKKGQQVYQVHCQSCHQADGKGMPPAIPGMVGGKITTGPVSGHVDVLLNGIKGTGMQAFGEQLTNEEIAAVITYERNAWGNDKKAGELVQPKTIDQARGGAALAEPSQEVVKPKVDTSQWDSKTAMAVGKSVYDKNCQSCHQLNGEGMPPMFPSLKGSKVVVGPVSQHIQLLLMGVKGTAMASFAWMSDEEIAGVITYKRNSWGNNEIKYGKDAGGLITPAEVKAMRGAK
jgi:cytochrome c oxidase subunit 2